MIGLLGVLMLVLAGSAPALAGPLHDAARAGDVAQLRALLADGVEMDARSERGETPLTLAILAGHAEVVQLLLDQGAAIDGRNAGGFTPLHAAAYAGDAAIAELLIERGADVNDAQNKAGVTPLFPAVEEDHKEVALLLVTQGVDQGWKERHGYTALTRGLFKGRNEIASLLRAQGAECQAPDVLGEALHQACLAAGK